MFCYLLKVLHHRNKVEEQIRKLKSQNNSIGLVPTMGALHNGHASLIETAMAENDVVIITIFVNPTQFDNQLDLENYPRTLESDVEMLQNISKDLIVYAPSVKDIYGGEPVTEHFNFEGLENEMEGKYRAGHFDGVGSIVKRLFNLIQPDRAYFGEKDFQQLTIIKKMVSQAQLNVQIVPVSIFRDIDGLALSSRNKRLLKEHREVAPFIYKTLQSVRDKFGTENAHSLIQWVENQFKNEPLLQLEYIVISDSETLKPVNAVDEERKYRAFIAAYAGDVRLIDNIALN